MGMKRLFLVFSIYVCVSSGAYSQRADSITTLIPVSESDYRLRKNLKHKYKPLIDYDIDWGVEVSFPLSANGTILTSIVVQSTYDNLAFEELGDGIATSRIRNYIRLVSDDMKIIGFVEDEKIITMKIADASRLLNKPVIIKKVFDLPSGKYKADIVFTDINSGVRKVKSRKFVVPAFKSEQND